MISEKNKNKLEEFGYTIISTSSDSFTLNRPVKLNIPSRDLDKTDREIIELYNQPVLGLLSYLPLPIKK